MWRCPDPRPQAALGPSLDLLGELVNFCVAPARLNSSCRLAGQGVAGGTPLPSSPSAWLRLVKELAPPAAPHASSAFTFLQVLVGALQASRGKDAERVFNRVLLKLPEPKLGQLTEYGLLHAGSLLLALRRAGERRAGELLVKLLSLPGLPAVNPPRKTRLTCSLALCLLLVQEGEDMGEVGRLATAMVGQAVAAWGADQNNVSKKVVMKEMVSVWMKRIVRR